MKKLCDVHLNTVRRIMCEYYGLSSTEDRTRLYRRRPFGIHGQNSHYVFCCRTNGTEYRAFGKRSSNTLQEYKNLRFLEQYGAQEGIQRDLFPRGLGLVNAGKKPLLLQEYVGGYSSLRDIVNKWIVPHG